MRFKTLKIEREVRGGKIDGRVLGGLRWGDSLVKELSRGTSRAVDELVITDALRIRPEQMALNLARGRDTTFCSFHEVGGAADVRIRDWPKGLATRIANEIMAAFPELEVVVENDHLHLEVRGRLVDFAFVRDVRWRSETKGGTT